MTSIIVWRSMDNRQTTAINFASDSRFSWGSSKRWNSGQKLFKCTKFPEIFGYCGDILLATQLITKLTHLIDLEIIYKNKDSIDLKVENIKKFIEDTLKECPSQVMNECTILYAVQDHKKIFYCYKFKVSSSSSEVESLNLDGDSNLLISTGSGGKEFVKYYNKKYKNSDIGGLSRSYFIAFCEFIKSGKDQYTGGGPQLMSIYGRKPRLFGISIDNERYINGSKITSETYNFQKLEWRNKNFERLDGFDQLRLVGAQIQPDPTKKKIINFFHNFKK